MHVHARYRYWSPEQDLCYWLQMALLLEVAFWSSVPFSLCMMSVTNWPPTGSCVYWLMTLQHHTRLACHWAILFVPNKQLSPQACSLFEFVHGGGGKGKGRGRGEAVDLHHRSYSALCAMEFSIQNPFLYTWAVAVWIWLCITTQLIGFSEFSPTGTASTFSSVWTVHTPVCFLVLLFIQGSW